MARTIEASLRREQQYTQAKQVKRGQAWVRSESPEKRNAKKSGKARREWGKVRG